MCIQCDDHIPGALITDSTLRSKKQPYFVAPPGRGDESDILKALKGINVDQSKRQIYLQSHGDDLQKEDDIPRPYWLR